MIIRPADIDDAKAIATIHVRSWQQAYAEILPTEGLANLSIDDRTAYWSQILQDEERQLQVLLAEDDGEIVGFASWGPDTEPDADPDIPTLYSIYVRPESAGKGYGSELLQATEVEMIASGAVAARLWVMVENTAARKFYDRYGWKPEPESEQERTFYAMKMRIIRYQKSFL